AKALHGRTWKHAECGFVYLVEVLANGIYKGIHILDGPSFLGRLQVDVTDGKSRTSAGVDGVIARYGRHSSNRFPLPQHTVGAAQGFGRPSQGGPGWHGKRVRDKTVVLRRDKR